MYHIDNHIFVVEYTWGTKSAKSAFFGYKFSKELLLLENMVKYRQIKNLFRSELKITSLCEVKLKLECVAHMWHNNKSSFTIFHFEKFLCQKCVNHWKYLFYSILKFCSIFPLDIFSIFLTAFLPENPWRVQECLEIAMIIQIMNCWTNFQILSDFSETFRPT